MKSNLAAGLLSLVACGSPKVTPHFAENRPAYEDAVRAISQSAVFRRHSRRKEACELDGADIAQMADLATVRALFQSESIDHIRMEPDTSIRFSFPVRKTALGLGAEGRELIYLPNKKYWYMPNEKISNTTLNQNEYLGDGWFQSEWTNNIAD